MYDGFAADFGRRHASMHEYEHRRAVFHSNRQLIDAHNTAGHNFTLGINRFADWTEVCTVHPFLKSHNVSIAVYIMTSSSL